MVNKKISDVSSDSERKRAHAEMLKTALARPGVKEAMEVYGRWQEKDRGLDSYRAATKKPMKTATTNSSGFFK